MEAVKEKVQLQKYPAYKDSGVEWLGEIPEKWNSLPIRAIFEERNEKNEGPQTDFILSVTKDRGVIPYDEKGQIGNNKSEDIERYKVVYPNDFVINKMNVVIGSLGMSKYLGAFSQVYLVYKPKTTDIHIEYYSYLFSNPAFYKSLIRYCTGIMELRESLNKTEFKKLVLPFPDYRTQTSIATFLDAKCGKIDAAIAQKQQLIELLKERKQVIIQNAVTKGLDPEIKMKDSGVEWIGEIPEHWDFTQIKKIASTTSGSTPSSGNITEYYNGDIPWVRTMDLNDGVLFDVTEKITEKAVKDTSCKVLPENAVCVAMYGGPGTIGKHAILKFRGTLNQAVCGILPSKKLVPFFLYYYTKFYRPHWMIVAKGSRVDPNINQDEVKKMFITLPSLDEQKAIVAYIEDENSKMERAIELQQQQIEKLKEYKSNLIDAAVTGKVKIN